MSTSIATHWKNGSVVSAATSLSMRVTSILLTVNVITLHMLQVTIHLCKSLIISYNTNILQYTNCFSANADITRHTFYHNVNVTL